MASDDGGEAGIGAAIAVLTTAFTTGRLETCWAKAWPEPPNVKVNAAAIADARPAPKNFFNLFSNMAAGRPTIA